MALRSAPFRLVHVLYRSTTPSRMLSSKPVTVEKISMDNEVLETPDKAFQKADLTFTDTKCAFANKKTSELIRALLVFRMCSFDFLVNKNKELMKLSRRILGRHLFRTMMRSTFYGHFVAGEDQDDIKPMIMLNRKFGVKSILDYSVEKDIHEDEVKAQVKAYLDEAVVDTENPSGANTRYQANLEFADRSESVTSARTYYYESEHQCDKHMDIFLKCIDAVSHSTKAEGFAAIKLTALGRPQLLLQMSDFLVQMERFFHMLVTTDSATLPPSMRVIDKESFQENLKTLGVEITYDQQHEWFTLLDISGSGQIDLLEWSQLKNVTTVFSKIFHVRDAQTGQYQQLVPSLTAEGLEEFRNMLHRVDTIVTHAKSKGVRVMVDAEQTYFQPAIRRITIEMMRRFNKDIAIVFNTYQCYLKDALDHITLDLRLAEDEDFYFGAKIVRGAYMDQERSRAKQLGYEDPVNPNYEATTKMYESVLGESFRAIQRRPKGKIAVMVASHNEDSVRFAVHKMKEYGVLSTDRLICFGQLLGMCDQVSFTLGQAGYSVYKYVPFGPIEEVLPYLSRRAMENKGFLSKVQKERSLIWRELKRRLKNGDVLYNPVTVPASEASLPPST